MTTEKAISRLIDLKACLTAIDKTLYGEALDMAIEALSAEPNYGASTGSSTGSSTDCISRQAVLDAIDAAAWAFCDYLIRNGRNDEQKPVSLFADKLREYVREELPPVNPQPKTGHWIPVSERLPEDGRPVLIYAWNVHHVIAQYDEFRTENGYKKTWVTADAWNGNVEIKHEVIAWMPLPSLYQPQESEDKE